MVKIEISNRATYSILAILIIILGSVSVYAVTVMIEGQVIQPVAGSNPGHSLSELNGPTGTPSGGCFLKWDGSSWDCRVVSTSWITQSSGTPMVPTIQPLGVYTYGVTSIGSSPSSGKRLYVVGNSSDTYTIYSKNNANGYAGYFDGRVLSTNQITSESVSTNWVIIKPDTNTYTCSSGTTGLVRVSKISGLNTYRLEFCNGVTWQKVTTTAA